MEIKIFKTSINELISIFRESLYSLKGPLSKAKISWKDIDSYDDWESICECLFHNIVSNSIKNSIAEEFSFEEFDFSLFSYKEKYFDCIFICIEFNDIEKNSTDGYKVFVDISSKDEVFDLIRCIEVDFNGEIIKESEKFIAFNDVKFSLKKITENRVLSVKHLNVQL